MVRYRVCDVMVELAELSMDLVGELRHQLQYYRASAYKHESSRALLSRVDQLRLLFELLGDEIFQEMMADYDALAAAGAQSAAPGECALALRINRLIAEASPALQEYQRRVSQKRSALSDDFLRHVQTNRRSLLSVCRQGSRSWELLKNL